MPHSYQGHHGSSSRRGGAGIFGALALGFGFWGSIALGGALGFAGAAAFFSGAAIIIGGVMALGALIYGVAKIHQSCRGAYHRRQQRLAERRQAARSVNDNRLNTHNVMQHMSDDGLRAAANVPPQPPQPAYNPAYTPYMEQPPGYANQQYLRECERRRQKESDAPSAPAAHEVQDVGLRM